MNNIAKFNSIHKKKLGISLLLLVSTILVIGLILFTVYTNKLRDIIDEEAKITLQTVSSQNIINLKNTISDKQELLKSLALNITSDKNFNIESIMKKLELYQEINSFYNMGIIDKKGICYTTFGEKLDLSKNDFFINAMSGISGISKSYLSEDKTVMLNIFTIPIFLEDEVEIILMSTYKSSDFSKLLNIPSFDGHGQSIVVDSNGNLISKPSNTEYSYLDTIYKSTKETNNSFIEFEYLDNEYLAYSEPVGINDWYLISYVPKQYVYYNLDIINNTVFLGSLLTYATIITFLFLLFNEYIKYEKKISSIVFIDELTNEKNYEYLKLYFKNMSEKEKKDKFLLVFDIDKFKNINIMYGSNVGDKLLKYIPKTFKQLFPHDEVFKYQADIFIAVVNGVSQEEIINKITKIQLRIKKDIEKKLVVPMNLSFGICSLQEFDDLHSIYNNALISKNEVKKKINKKFNFFNKDSKDKIIENHEIESKFIDSLKNNEFEVWYQPKYDMKTNKIFGAEALVRWREKDGNIISPAKFIPVFENNGQIIKLDEAIIELVFKDIYEMKKLGYDIKPISINLSRAHIENFKIVNTIKEFLVKYKIDPKIISFEITESILIEDNDLLNELIFQIHKIGCAVDIDDYGTGNSTLNSLSSSDFNTLKLDKSFIDNIGNPKVDIIIKSTIKMANELNMQIIAEGVETQEQINFLIDNNCNIAQGYYFSKPLDKISYFSLLQKIN